MPEVSGRILIVDDQERNRYVLCHVLERAGYSCETASTGRQALERSATRPDLIILDVNLPDVSGYEVCRRIKENPLTTDIPILQISASFVNSDATAKALEGGADNYLTHPIDSVVLVATVRAMLRLRRAEAASRVAAAEWQAGFDALTEGVLMTDAQGRIARFNRAFASFCRDIGKVERQMLAGDLLQKLLGQEVKLTDAMQVRRSKEFVVGEKTILLTVDKIGDDIHHLGYVIVLTDVTDRKVAEYALRMAEQLAGSGRMAHAIAHEINNPLEAVVNLVYLAKHSEALDEIKPYLDVATEELERVARITRQSLSFHRDTAAPVSVSISTVVREVIAMYAKIAEGKGVALKFDETPTLAVRGFPGQLRQVFSNLIRNAIDASVEGSTIDIRVRPYEGSEGQGVKVFVHDFGTGLTERVRHQMFDPFFTTKELKGSGLGLWVTKALVSNHGGHIRYRSGCLRRGTSFAVFLPVRGVERRNEVPQGTSAA